jgi:hypothetical protein
MTDPDPQPNSLSADPPTDPVYAPQKNILSDRDIDDVAKAMKAVAEGVCHNDLQRKAAQTYVKYFIEGAKHEETKALKDLLENAWGIIGQHLEDERNQTLAKLIKENADLNKQRNGLWSRRHGDAPRPDLREEKVKNPINLDFSPVDAWRFTRQEQQERVDEFCDFLGKDDVALAENTRAHAKKLAHLQVERQEISNLIKQATMDDGWIDTAKRISPDVMKIMEESAKNKQLKKDIEGLEGSIQYDQNL